jgi:SAM-dependent methyltransferase
MAKPLPEDLLAGGSTAIRSSSHPCPLCGGTLGKPMLTISQPDRFERSVGISADGYWRVWRGCEECGAAISEQRAGDAEKVAAIAQKYYEVDIGSDIAAKYRHVMDLPNERSDNAGRAARILQKLFATWFPQKSVREVIRVLDVGAGTGVFLAKLNQLCFEAGIRLEAAAIEPDPLAAEHLRGLDFISVYEDVLDERFAQMDFDLITFNKVLEHIRDPKPVLAHAVRALAKTSGLLYVEVPDLQTIYNRPVSDNILGAMHHHLYAPASLDKILAGAGLVTIELERILEPSTKLTIYGFAIPNNRFKFLASGCQQ